MKNGLGRALACVAVVVSTVLIAGQTHPDFTGTWVVEKVEAQSGPQGGFGGPDGPAGGRGGRGGRGGGLGRGGAGGGQRQGNRGDDSQPTSGDRQGPGGPGGLMFRQGERVTIKQTAERLIITRETDNGGVMTSYALDGSESRNTGPAGATMKSKTKWEGVALVTDGSRSMTTARGDVTLKTREVRTLSDEGQAMTLVTTLDLPRGKQIATVTFGRR